MLFAALFVIQQPKVSLEIRGERLVVCAPKFAQALGMERLDIKPPFQEEVAAIRVTNVDRETLKQKIEQAFLGTFTRNETGWAFEQTPEQRAKERDDHLARKRGNVQVFLNRAKEISNSYMPMAPAHAALLLKSESNFGETEVKVPWKGMDEWEDPIGRFVCRLMARMSLGLWRDVIEHNERVVFALRPTPMQRTLPMAIGDLVSKLVAEQAIYSQAAAKFNGETVSMTNGWNKVYDPLQPTEVTDLTVALADDQVELKSYNAKGVQIISVMLPLSEFTFGPSVDLPDAPKIKLTAIGNELEETRHSKGWLLPSRGDHDPALEQPEISAQLRDVLSNPEDVDPFSIVGVDFLFGANPGKNIVVNMDYWLARNTDLSEAAHHMFQFEQPNVEYKNGWLTIHREFPFQARPKVLTRSRLKSIFKMFSNGSCPSLEEQAQMVELHRDGQMHESELTEGLVLLGRGNAMPQPADALFLKLFGALSESERAAAKSAPVSLSRLNALFLRALHQHVFHTERVMPSLNYEVLGSIRQPSGEGGLTFIRSLLSDEPTYFLPNGLHEGMTLKIEESVSYNLRIRRKSVAKEGPAELLIRPLDLGMYWFDSERPAAKNRDEQTSFADYDLKSIQVVPMRRVTLTLSASREASYEVSGEQQCATDGKTYSRQSLPTNVSKEVLDGYESGKIIWEMRKKFEDKPPPTH